MITPQIGISLMMEHDFLNAALPLFESGEIEVIEWSFDMGWGPQSPPDQCLFLLDHFSRENRLIGHGVSFSILSGQWTARQQHWLDCLQEEFQERQYRHVTEHFGFMTAGNFHKGAPLPVPLTPSTLKLGQYRLQQVASICKVPVGLENLALAFGPEDVAQQGIFLDQLVSAVDGFIILDLHNIYCQLCNFKVDPLVLLKSYPLDKVKEIHVSGGCWYQLQTGQNEVLRCDSHDEAIPNEVFDLLNLALPLCPKVEFIIFERLGHSIAKEEAFLYQEEFYRLKNAIKEIYSCMTIN